MEDIESRLREMKEKIDRQDAEIRGLRDNATKNAVTTGRTATATANGKKPAGKQQNKPRFQNKKAKFGTPRFQEHPFGGHQNAAPTQLRPGAPAGCSVEEYQITRRVYHPAGGAFSGADPRSQFARPSTAAPIMGFGADNSFWGSLFPDSNMAAAPQNAANFHDHHQAPKPQPTRAAAAAAAESKKQVVNSPEVTKLRQNHQPFIVAKAFRARNCAGCGRKIHCNCLMLKHREIEAYRHPEGPWKGLIFSEHMITQFYHLDRACLEKRGFERDYLSMVCDVVVDKDVQEQAAGPIERCGLHRPVAKKLSLAELVPKLHELDITAAADIPTTPEADPKLMGADPKLLGADPKLLECGPTDEMLMKSASDSDDDDKFELC